VSLALTYYGYASGVGNFGAAASDFYGAFSGDVAGAEHYANVATVATSVSGGATFLITDNLDTATTAANVEGLVLFGFQGGLNQAEGRGIPFPDVAEVGDTAVNLLLPGSKADSQSSCQCN
jgi:hypothetical protein